MTFTEFLKDAYIFFTITLVALILFHYVLIDDILYSVLMSLVINVGMWYFNYIDFRDRDILE